MHVNHAKMMKKYHVPIIIGEHIKEQQLTHHATQKNTYENTQKHSLIVNIVKLTGALHNRGIYRDWEGLVEYR